MQVAEAPREFKSFIQAIGRGQKTGRTLSQTEAYLAMKMLINGQVTPEQRGAFLMLLRVREETSEEIAGFIQALREVNNRGLEDLNCDLDLGCYAGKRRQLPWFVLSVIVLAQNGKRVFLHGTHEPDSNRLYLDTVLPQIGFPLAGTIEQSRQQLNDLGMTYLPLATVNPALDNLIQLRAQFGLRSCANTLARMLNPSKSSNSLQGVFHKHVDIRHQQAAILLNTENVLCFRGEGGEVEYNPERDVTLRFSRRGKTDDIELPAMQQNWTIKDQHMHGDYLLEVWQRKSENDYADNAVTGTLSLMLMLMGNVSWKQALELASQMWLGRSKSVPFG